MFSFFYSPKLQKQCGFMVADFPITSARKLKSTRKFGSSDWMHAKSMPNREQLSILDTMTITEVTIR